MTFFRYCGQEEKTMMQVVLSDPDKIEGKINIPYWTV